MNTSATTSGAAPSAPKPEFVTQNVFTALLGEVFERLGSAEGRIEDLERQRSGANNQIAELSAELVTLRRAA